MSERAFPFPVVHPVYEHDWSEYPEKIRVPMDDGKVVDYRMVIQQPAPLFKDALDKFTETCVGYKRRRRNRS
jgi:hypothetical protein